MDMKKLIFVAVLSIFTATQVFAISVIVAPRSVSMIAKENESAVGYAKVIAPNGFEKKIRIENIPDWLKVEPIEFTINRSNQQQVKLTASSNGLKIGDYNANLSITNVTENDKPDSVTLSVLFSVIEGKKELTASPRSIQIKQGMTRTVIVSNPLNEDIEATVSSSMFWVQVYPEKLGIPAHGSAIIWAKMTAKDLPGGNYASVINCESSIGKLQIPVQTVIESGVEFNPDTIVGSGPVTITNKLKNTVVIKPIPVEGVTFSSSKFEIGSGKSKTLKITFTGDKKPDYIAISITGGQKNVHNLKVMK